MNEILNIDTIQGKDWLTGRDIMKIKIFIILAVTLLFSVNAYGIGQDGDITIEAEGYGVSKEASLLAAKREAVSSGIGTVLISETEVENFTLKKDLVLTRTVGAVRSYKVLYNGLDGASYRTKIRAVVSMSAIKDDLAALKILLESMDKPRMMVLIREENSNAAETAILDFLSQKEFELVDAAAVAALLEKDEKLIRKATEGDPAAAAQLGAANGAEFVIVGKVVKSSADNKLLAEAGMLSGQASITARVVNCSNAAIIASKSARGAAAHIDLKTAQENASDKAARKLMDRALFERVVAAFQDMVNNGMTLEVTVDNVGDYKTQKAVQKIIGKADVSSVSKRGFGNGKLKLAVVFRGSADSFADVMDGKEVMGRKMAVTGIAGSRVSISLR
jgi:hypothetical protein